MKLHIQLYLAGLSLLNTVSILEVFGVERARSTVQNWVYKADLQPANRRSPDHIAVDETVIQLNDEKYWLYAAVDPQTNNSLHTKLEPTITTVLVHSFLTELSEKYDINDPVFLVDGSHSLQDACQWHGFDFRHETHGNRNAIKYVLRDLKAQSCHILKLLHQRRSQHSRRLAQIIQFRMGSAYLTRWLA